ncbi:hypothetical protein [Actinoplanes sp. NPDC049599]|uniref:hypothetical protein n=1 Tax=Actinoplanes sp. NPDC049599 TaxID=3363903 RepID=UPI00378BCF5F
MLHKVSVSVGRTWRYATDDAASVADDKAGYRHQIDTLKGGPGPDGFGLPWPRYRSTLWTRMFNGTYQDIPSRVLVPSLIPLLYEEAVADLPQSRGPCSVSVFRHPFAVSTVMHIELAPIDPWPAAAGAAELFRTLLETPLPGSGQVRDGVALNTLPPLPTVDADGRAAGFEQAGSFVMVSALHQQAPDPGALASALATLFEDSGGNGAVPLRSRGGAIDVRGEVVGLVLPGDLPRAGQRLRCLHHNLATLLAYMQNLATLTPSSSTLATRWFQTRAATLLNHLYRRAPLPETNSIYRSRLAEAWINGRSIAPSINALARDLPPLPEPA